jgi:cystathionine beta-synthase
MQYENVLEVIGETPLVRLNKIVQGFAPRVYAKLEFMNPCGSIKDRIALKMVEEAERRGELKPGGTIVEATSGNTGFGLAIVASIKGYKAIFTINDKQSREKINLMKALGAEVIVCPTDVPPDDPRSYTATAKRLAKEIPNCFFPFQYDSQDNILAHYETTGPEIWQDSDGKITHLVAGIGTGGTITGIARYLKEKNPNVKIIGVDPVGSILYDFFHTGKVVESHPYKVEGIGEDFFPKALDFELLDDMIQVTDKESFLWTRRLAKEEGIFAGGSSGSAIAATMKLVERLKKTDFVVAILPDTGHRYLSKIYNDEWMRENQYLESNAKLAPLTAKDIINDKSVVKELLFVTPSNIVADAIRKMRGLEISQMPVFEGEIPVGSIYEDDIMKAILDGKDINKLYIREIMGKPFPLLNSSATIDEITRLISKYMPAALVDIGGGRFDIITKYDLLQSIVKKAI